MNQGPEQSFRDKLSMFDTFGGRIPIYPAEVKGVWRSRRNLVQAVLLFIFLVLPWLSFGGEPAFLFGLEKKVLILFGIKFWAHDGPLFFFVLGSIALTLAVATALFGRVWCGWACPQTVFLDGVIRKIESLVEGNHLQRRALNNSPMTFTKLSKKLIKWFLFIGFSLLITHSFLAYFFGKDRVLEMMVHRPSENWGSFVFILFLNALVLFDLTWFREQFCLIVCPYGRIQSLLLDTHTVTVQYDETRGEPRKGKAKPDEKQGDCVACGRCVQVCPTGVDIRNGIQLECISCTACIDACDEIMEKVHKPKGLIRYKATTQKPVQWFRPRVLLYMIFLLFVLIALVVTLSRRHSLEVTLLRSLDTPYFITDTNSSKKITNSYRLHLHNQNSESHQVKIELLPIAGLSSAHIQIPDSQLLLKASEFKMLPFVVDADESEFLQQSSVRGVGSLKVKFKVDEQILEADFVGPRN